MNIVPTQVVIWTRNGTAIKCDAVFSILVTIVELWYEGRAVYPHAADGGVQPPLHGRENKARPASEGGPYKGSGDGEHSLKPVSLWKEKDTGLKAGHYKVRIGLSIEDCECHF